MKIKISELKSILNKLFDYIEENKIESIELDKDAYWYIDEDNVYNPYSEPSEFSLGQLEDDWENLKKILNKHYDPVGYDLVWASTIMRAIGEKIT